MRLSVLMTTLVFSCPLLPAQTSEMTFESARVVQISNGSISPNLSGVQGSVTLNVSFNITCANTFYCGTDLVEQYGTTYTFNKSFSLQASPADVPSTTLSSSYPYSAPALTSSAFPSRWIDYSSSPAANSVLFGIDAEAPSVLTASSAILTGVNVGSQVDSSFSAALSSSWDNLHIYEPSTLGNSIAGLNSSLFSTTTGAASGLFEIATVNPSISPIISGLTGSSAYGVSSSRYQPISPQMNGIDTFTSETSYLGSDSSSVLGFLQASSIHPVTGTGAEWTSFDSVSSQFAVWSLPHNAAIRPTNLFAGYDQDSLAKEMKDISDAGKKIVSWSITTEEAQ